MSSSCRALTGDHSCSCKRSIVQGASSHRVACSVAGTGHSSRCDRSQRPARASTALARGGSTELPASRCRECRAASRSTTPTVAARSSERERTRERPSPPDVKTLPYRRGRVELGGDAALAERGPRPPGVRQRANRHLGVRRAPPGARTSADLSRIKCELDLDSCVRAARMYKRLVSVG